MIKPQSPEPIKLSHGTIQGPSFDVPAATREQWRVAYDTKVREFARETLKTSTLIQALHALGCRAAGAHHPHCPGCLALFNVDAIDPAGAAPATAGEEKDGTAPNTATEETRS